MVPGTPTTPTTPNPQLAAQLTPTAQQPQLPTTPTNLTNQPRLTPPTTSAHLAALSQQQLAHQNAILQQQGQHEAAAAAAAAAAATSVASSVASAQQPAPTHAGIGIQQPVYSQAGQQPATTLAQPAALASPAPSGSGMQQSAVVSQSSQIPGVNMALHQQALAAQNAAMAAGRPPSLGGTMSGSEAGQSHVIQTTPVTRWV